MMDFIFDYFSNLNKKQNVEAPKKIQTEHRKKQRPSRPAIPQNGIKNAVITVRFHDGYEVNFMVNNIIDEYIKLRLMYHATYDRPEIIPYLYTDFQYRITQ